MFLRMVAEYGPTMLSNIAVNILHTRNDSKHLACTDQSKLWYLDKHAEFRSVEHLVGQRLFDGPMVFDVILSNYFYDSSINHGECG